MKKEINAGAVAYDLPKDHALRVEMQKHEVEMKEKLQAPSALS